MLWPYVFGLHMIHRWPIVLGIYYAVFGVQQFIAHRREQLPRRFRIMRWVLAFLPPTAVLIMLGWFAALPSGVEPFTQPFVPVFTLPIALLAAIVLFALTFKELKDTAKQGHRTTG